mgnify:CR=1 FL=1
MIKQYFAGIIATIVAVGAALLYRKGRKDADDENVIEDFNEYLATRKRMDETGGPSDADVQRWLHERGQYKRPGDL